MSACLSPSLCVLLPVCLDVAGAHRVSVGVRDCAGFETVDAPVSAANDPSVLSWAYLLVHGQCRRVFVRWGYVCADGFKHHWVR